LKKGQENYDKIKLMKPKTKESIALGKRIKEVRSEQNLNQADFAKAIGSSRDTVARTEVGAQTPQERVLRQICKTFEVNYMWLLTGESDHKDKEQYGRLKEEYDKLDRINAEQKATIAALEKTITILATQLRGSSNDERSN
tara:strand:+ start:455 stop:877 length:423 start_codon:yes stop_codon:yes gene_type:complete